MGWRMGLSARRRSLDPRPKSLTLLWCPAEVRGFGSTPSWIVQGLATMLLNAHLSRCERPLSAHSVATEEPWTAPLGGARTHPHLSSREILGLRFSRRCCNGATHLSAEPGCPMGLAEYRREDVGPFLRRHPIRFTVAGSPSDSSLYRAPRRPAHSRWQGIVSARKFATTHRWFGRWTPSRTIGDGRLGGCGTLERKLWRAQKTGALFSAIRSTTKLFLTFRGCPAYRRKAQSGLHFLQGSSRSCAPRPLAVPKRKIAKSTVFCQLEVNLA